MKQSGTANIAAENPLPRSLGFALGILGALLGVILLQLSSTYLLVGTGLLLAILMLPSIWDRPQVGLYGFLLTYPLTALFTTQELLTISIPNVFLLITSLALFTQFRKHEPHPPLIRRILVLLPIFLLASVVAVVMAPDSIVALRGMPTRVGYCLTVLALVVLLKDWERIKFALRCIVISATFASAATILVLFVPRLFPKGLENLDPTEPLLPGLPAVRPTALFVSVHPFASWAIYALAIAAASLMSPRLFGVRRRWTAISVVLIGSGLVVNQTRSAWVAVLVLLALAICVAPLYLGGRRKLSLGLLTAFVVLGSSFALNNPSAETIGGDILRGAGREESTAERLLQYQIGFDILREHPWFGIGPMGALFYLEPAGLHPNIHNIFLEELVAFGIVGFVPYFAFLPLAFVGPVRLLFSNGRGQRLIGASIIIASTSAMVVYQVYSGVGEKSYWIVIGLGAATSRLLHSGGGRSKDEKGTAPAPTPSTI